MISHQYYNDIWNKWIVRHEQFPEVMGYGDTLEAANEYLANVFEVHKRHMRESIRSV